ncbi:myo-inositol oxygenase [Pyrrhoderma noxium]|uniref:Inositol oxygenase n=1 Tax=Pyrrhoderma noxium TaxID=2282107 RepID=A0A286U7C5_9AGAM|nr:myo-inositol oxygenase [Pyrrhoderma noxium]
MTIDISTVPKPTNGRVLDETSDAIDEVNVLKGKTTASWKADSEFDSEKDKTKFRQYENACDRVKAFYKEQHEKQTVAFNLKAREEFKKKTRARMSVWQAIELLNTLVDDSDPDTSVSQIEHLLQTAEAIRRDGKPEWMQVTGLVHDLGKLLFFFGSEGQWDVVGDTFVVGCAFSEKNIYPETFQATLRIGQRHAFVGHDEYLYHVCKDQSTLPEEGLAMIRYHSFYPWHREEAYMYLANEKDVKTLEAVRAFNPYDLYSKSDSPCDAAALRPYYENLIAKYFPPEVNW